MRDKRLIAQMQAGERGALDRVIEIYTPYISVIVHRILSPTLPREEIEETVADVFITLWKNLNKLTGDTLKGWLAAVARTQAINRLRQASPQHEALDDSGNVLPDTLPPPDAQVMDQERAALLWDVINRLGSPDREIFLRYYYGQQTTSYIADALSMSETAVRSRLARGRKKLRDDLTERGGSLEELL